jgi:hypothetical protein
LFANANAIKKLDLFFSFCSFFLQQTAISSRCAANSQLNKCSQDKRSMLGSSTPLPRTRRTSDPAALLIDLFYFYFFFLHVADELHDYGAWRSLAHDERPREGAPHRVYYLSEFIYCYSFFKTSSFNLFVGGVARAWNEEFQCLLESRNLSDAGNEVKVRPRLSRGCAPLANALCTHTRTHAHDVRQRTAELRKLCEEFATVAKQIGKRIIEELFLPPVQKTIPPATAQVGGLSLPPMPGNNRVLTPHTHTPHTHATQHTQALLAERSTFMRPSAYSLRSRLTSVACTAGTSSS